MGELDSSKETDLTAPLYDVRCGVAVPLGEGAADQDSKTPVVVAQAVVPLGLELAQQIFAVVGYLLRSSRYSTTGSFSRLGTDVAPPRGLDYTGRSRRSGLSGKVISFTVRRRETRHPILELDQQLL